MADELFAPNRRTTERLAQTVKRVLDRNRWQPPQPSAVGAGPAGWYWGELLTDVSAPSNGWTGPTGGTAKIMVPDPASVAALDSPVHFKELGTGAVSGVTPSVAGPPAVGIVITSPGHGLREGRPVYLVSPANPGGAVYRVGTVTSTTFELAGTSGDGSIWTGGTWCIATPFTNRDPSLSGTAGAVCKIEFGFGEWSLKWVGC